MSDVTLDNLLEKHRLGLRGVGDDISVNQPLIWWKSFCF